MGAYANRNIFMRITIYISEPIIDRPVFAVRKLKKGKR
jgi:hypothetical protein